MLFLVLSTYVLSFSTVCITKFHRSYVCVCQHFAQGQSPCPALPPAAPRPSPWRCQRPSLACLCALALGQSRRQPWPWWSKMALRQTSTWSTSLLSAGVFLPPRTTHHTTAHTHTNRTPRAHHTNHTTHTTPPHHHTTTHHSHHTPHTHPHAYHTPPTTYTTHNTPCTHYTLEPQPTLRIFDPDQKTQIHLLHPKFQILDPSGARRRQQQLSASPAMPASKTRPRC